MALPRHFRFLVWYIQAFLKRHHRTILLGVFAGILAATLAIFLTRFVPPSRTRQSIGLIGTYTADSLPSEILGQLSQGLTTISPDGEPLPGLASSWSVSPDLKNYTFYLTPDLHWTDGTPVKAGDISYKFKDASVSVLSDTSLLISLTEPYTPLPIIVSRPVFKKNFLGIGPYQLVSTKRSGDNLIEIDLSPLDLTKSQIAFHFYPTENAAITAWKMGEVQTVRDISTLPPDNWQPQVTTEVKTDRYVGVFFNLQDSMLGDKNLRQALAYAIKNKVADNAQRALGPISPESWAYNPSIKPYDFDFQKAKQLVAKVATNSADIKLKLTTFPSLLTFAQSIVDDWQSLGVNVSLEVVPSIPDSFQVMLITQMVPPDPDQYSLWHSTQTDTNITQLKNPKIDKLLEDGRKTEGLAARKAIYDEFQKTITEEVPVIFLYHPALYTIARP